MHSVENELVIRIGRRSFRGGTNLEIVFTSILVTLLQEFARLADYNIQHCPQDIIPLCTVNMDLKAVKLSVSTAKMNFVRYSRSEEVFKHGRLCADIFC